MEEDLKNPLEWPCARQCTDVAFFREQAQQNLAVFEALVGAFSSCSNVPVRRFSNSKWIRDVENRGADVCYPSLDL